MKKIISVFLALCLCISLSACKSAEAKQADELILSIGEVTLDKADSIEEALQFYNSLTAEQKEEVENLDLLNEANAKLTSLKKIANAEMLIDAIGVVTIHSESSINDASRAVNALTSEEKKQVSNISVFTDAEYEFNELNRYWKIDYYVDSFGDATSSAFLRGDFEGIFSNSATTGSDLKACLYYDPAGPFFSIRLIEYGSYLASLNYYDEDDVYIKFKINGETLTCHPYSIYGSDLTIKRSWDADIFNALFDALEKGDEISCAIETGKYIFGRYDIGSNYIFTISGRGFIERYNELE